VSQFAWLDYSELERRKMLDIVDLFREHDTRDELGLGSVRDAFADLLFPGTSTIMTRARYFLFVPWIYQRLERQRIESAHVAERARRLETDLIAVIEKSDDSEGNIGTRVGATLKRLPSSIYWQGLGVWGIRAFKGSQAQYHRSLDRHYQQLTRHGSRGSERGVEHDDVATVTWHPGLAEPPSTFPRECSLRLTRDEAKYLAERIRISPASSGSLLAELVAQGWPNDDVSFAWEHAHLATLPANLRELLDHARNFSEAMHGAALLYNLVLAEQAQRDLEVADYRERIDEWADIVHERSQALSSWRRERFWQLVQLSTQRITAPTRDFIDRWLDLMLAGNASRLRANLSARGLIRDRERRLKKNLARIDNPRARELWNGASGTAQLDFRWRISRQLLNDIFTGLEAADA
jgi:hypothetical protein